MNITHSDAGSAGNHRWQPERPSASGSGGGRCAWTAMREVNEQAEDRDHRRWQRRLHQAPRHRHPLRAGAAGRRVRADRHQRAQSFHGAADSRPDGRGESAAHQDHRDDRSAQGDRRRALRDQLRARRRARSLRRRHSHPAEIRRRPVRRRHDLRRRHPLRPAQHPGHPGLLSGTSAKSPTPARRS